VIVPRTSRTEILAKLNKKISANLPIMIASAGSGLVAKLLEEAGVDCVNTFSGARLRANGMGTMSMMWPILDSNRQTMDYTREDILPAMKGDSFVCACMNPNDPLRDMRQMLEELRAMGVESVSNIGPSVSYVDKDSNLYKVLRSAGITFEREIEFLALAKEMDFHTIGLAFDLDDAIQMNAESKPDLFCFHAGTTKGGRMGYDSGETIEVTAERTEEAYGKIRAVHPEVMLVAHGAALETPEDAQYILNHTTGHGFWTGSSTERLPIERAVTAAAKEFRALKFPSR
jgi:predicted TIM-barrel enzyme